MGQDGSGGFPLEGLIERCDRALILLVEWRSWARSVRMTGEAGIEIPSDVEFGLRLIELPHHG